MKPPSNFGRRQSAALDPLNKNRLKPTKSRTINPTLEFAKQGGMITEDEYEACLKGDMQVNRGVKGTYLFNVNFKHPTLLTGESMPIHMGRATEVRIARLLGLNE